MVLATTVVTTLAVGIGSFTGSRAITLTAIIGWQTVATGLLYLATFLGAARDLVLLIALCRFLPGQAIGTRAHPGSSNALNNYKLAMPVAAAAVVILAWAGIAAAAGAWRTRTRDAMRIPGNANSLAPRPGLAGRRGTAGAPGARPRNFSPGPASRGSALP